jgi:hypothetical protein
MSKNESIPETRNELVYACMVTVELLVRKQNNVETYKRARTNLYGLKVRRERERERERERKRERIAL